MIILNHNSNSISNSTKVPTVLATHNLTPEMQSLVNELKNVTGRYQGKASKIIARMIEQGRHNKLSDDAISSLIKFAIGDSISDRHIRRLLPEEFKNSQMIRGRKENEDQFSGHMSANSDSDGLRIQVQVQVQAPEQEALDKRDFAKLDYQSLLQVATHYYDKYMELLHSLSESHRKQLAGVMTTMETTQEK